MCLDHLLAAKGGETGNFGGLCGGYRGAICPTVNGTGTMGCMDTILDVIRGTNAGGATSFAQGVPRQVNGRTQCDSAHSCADWRSNFNTSGVAAAAALAKDAEVVVLVLGIDTYMEGEGNDRLNTSLSFAEKALVKAVLATGVPVVAVVVHGGSVSLDPLLPTDGSPKPAAIVDAGYLCDNQQALADLLFGLTNQWGKLAATIYSEAFALEENPIPSALDCGCDGSVAAYRTCCSCRCVWRKRVPRDTNH